MTMPPSMPTTTIPAPLPAKRTSKSAIISLILGILLCVPGLGLLAVIFGLIGIAKTGDANVKGRGMAVAGLFLGVLALGGWSYAGYKTYFFGKGIYDKIETAKAEVKAPGKAMGTNLINSLSSGDTAAARPLLAPSVDPAEVSRVAKELSTMGKITNFNPEVPEFSTIDGVWHFTLKGIATFDKGTTQELEIGILKESNAIKVEGIKVGNDIQFGKVR